MTSTPSSLSPRQLVERVFEAWAENDADAISDLYAEDAVMEFPFAPAGHPKRIQGREALRERRRVIGSFLADAKAWARYRPIEWHETTNPEVLIVECESYGELPGSGEFVRPYIYVFRIRNGEIVSLRDYADPSMPSEVVRRVTEASRPEAAD